MKRWLLLLGILLMGVVLNSYGVTFENEKDIYSYFESTGAEFIKLDVEAHCNVSAGEGEEEVAERLFSALGYSGSFNIARENSVTQLSSRQGNLEVNIKTRRLESENLTYVSIMLSQYSIDRNINNSIRGTISRAFDIYKAKPSFSSLISGKYNNKLSIPQMKERASSIFKSSGGSFVNGIDEGNLVSISGYVRGISERIKMDDDFINLNVALRYSENNGCTYIWIGSPIISVEY